MSSANKASASREREASLGVLSGEGELDDLTQLNENENSRKNIEVWNRKLEDIEERTVKK